MNLQIFKGGMKNKIDIDKLHEQKVITRCILKGMTLKQIAQELNCAKSTASYKTRNLYIQYSANDRFEFCINLFTKLVQEYKIKLEKLEKELEKYKKKTY